MVGRKGAIILDLSSPTPVVLATSGVLALGACIEGSRLTSTTRRPSYLDNVITALEWYGGLMLFSIHPRITPIARIYVPGLRFDIRRGYYPVRPGVDVEDILYAWSMLANGDPNGLLMIAGRLVYPKGYAWTVSNSGAYRLSPTCK